MPGDPYNSPRRSRKTRPSAAGDGSTHSGHGRRRQSTGGWGWHDRAVVRSASSPRPRTLDCPRAVSLPRRSRSATADRQQGRRELKVEASQSLLSGGVMVDKEGAAAQTGGGKPLTPAAGEGTGDGRRRHAMSRARERGSERWAGRF